MKHFPRTDLARQIADSLQGRLLFGDAPNGLFLAAPRRTGKSTFLQRDLQPELESRDVIVVYVDLWADQRRDPGDLIADAIARAITKHLGVVARVAKAAAVESVSLAGWLKIDTTRIGKPDGPTLTDALRTLTEMREQPVALIIDEAQHALTSMTGASAMTALKAARDALNRPGQTKLFLIMSGSDRDKLLRLVNTNGAPFFGSQIQRMPDLGPDFVAFVARLIEQERPELRPVDAEVLSQAFQLFGSKPQFLSAALGDALNPVSEGEGRFERRVLMAAQQRLRDDEQQMESEFQSLRPLEQAVLWRLLEQGPRFRPYDAEALRFYKEKVPLFGGDNARITPQHAQAALEAIRSRTPALVWKSAYGEYAVDEAMMHKWYEGRVRDGAWPPRRAEEQEPEPAAPADQADERAGPAQADAARLKDA